MALKGRDYADRVKAIGFEKATEHILMELIEQHKVLEKTLLEYAQQHDQMLQLIENVVGMGLELKKSHDFINSQLGAKVDPDAPLPSDDRS